MAEPKLGGETSEALPEIGEQMDDQNPKDAAEEIAAAEPTASAEVIDLTLPSEDEPDDEQLDCESPKEVSEGPMSTEEFLKKSAEMRRNEWTHAKQINMTPSESGTETETEPEPVMFTGITFSGPPTFGPHRAESLSQKWVASENAGSAGKAEKDKLRKMLPVCYMMNEAPDAGKTPKDPRPSPAIHSSDEVSDDMMVFHVYPCASNGEPFPLGTPVQYPMFMDETMRRGLFRELKYDFPLERGQWDVRTRMQVLRRSDTPLSLGYRADQAVEAKLIMYNIPPTQRGARKSKEKHSDNEDDRDTGAAAAAATATMPAAAASAEKSEPKAMPVVSLEVWCGASKLRDVRWGVHRHMWRLMSALSVVFGMQDHHIILRTQQHVATGIGCVIGTDSPHTLSLHHGNALHINYIPNCVQITSHFTPSLAVANRILTISGFLIDQDRVGGRRGMGRNKGNVKSTNITLKYQNSTKNYTVNEENSISLPSKTSKIKRKSRVPIRIGETKRRKTPLTHPHMRRERDFTISPHENTKVTKSEPYLDFPPDATSKSTKLKECDYENSQLTRIRLVRIRNTSVRPRRDRRQNIDLGGMVENYVKTQNWIKMENHSPTHKSQSNPPESQSVEECESEDLLKPGFRRVTIMTSQGPITRQYDQNKTVYTPDMRYPYKEGVTSVPERYRDKSPSVTRNEVKPENASSIKKNLVIDNFSPNSLSTKVETSSSDSETEGSLPEVNTEPRSYPHKETTMVTKQKKKKRKSQKQRRKDKKRSMYSETKRYRLLQTYLLVMDCHGKTRRVKAALDTQSNVSYAKTYLGQKRKWKSHESTVVKGVGGYYKNGIPLTTYVIKGKDVVPLDTRSPPEHMFKDPDGPELLLSAQHCAELSIDLNSVLSSMKHRDVKYLDRRKKTNSKNKIKSKHTCLISEKIMKQYMDKNGGTDKEPKQCTIEDVVIAEDFTPEQKQTVKAILHKYRDVFASSPDDIPPPMKGVEPHVFKMKKDVKPIYCKRPNWGPYQRKFLKLWTKKAIKQGLMEPAPKSQWASRPVLVGKYRGQTAKTDVPDGIRVCVDFTAVNEFIVKQPPQYTDPYEEIRKACGHEYYFEADGQKQFNSIPLAEESRDITTTWTPLGLMRWLRLIMGTKDASGRAQQVYAHSMSKHLTDEERNFLSNFQDDFLGFEDDIPSLLRIFEAFLRMCRKSGIMLNPAKIRVGIRRCKFYGFILSKKGMEPSEKNLDPVKKMTIPKNSSEVRSVLGVFNQFRHFFKRYDRLVLPLQKLLRKNEPFIWTEEATKGLETIRQALLSGELYLAAPDPTLPLILESDGSDDGWGAILLQIIKGVRRIIKMWSKQWKTLHMKRAPPYYKETAAWMNGLEKARIYVDYSPFPVKCITDHIPLTYVKNTSGKGPVSQFVLDNLSSLDYTIEYRQGSKLVEADAISRFPCLGPRELSPDGVKEAFNILLAALPDKWTSEKRVWVHAQKETEIIQLMVREWLSMMTRNKQEPVRRVPYTESVTADRIRKVDYSLALWAPPADNVQQIINEALDKDVPFACLTPSCLVNMVPNNPQNEKALKETVKIVLLRPELTWVVHKISSIRQHQVYSTWMEIESFGTGQEPINGIVRPPPQWNFNEWSKEQEKMIKESPQEYPKNRLHRRESDGFITFDLTKDDTVALVPKEYRSRLITWQHQLLCHAGDIKVYNALKKHWYWPTIKKQTRTVVRNCAACQLLKAKRARAHRHFRAKVFCTPRTSWGCDFYGVAESSSGHNNILGAIDLATSECRLFACKNRSAATVTNCILHGIVLRDGCPLHIHSDAAREFISKAMKKLCKIIGCKQTTTLAHHPTGNSTIERLWQYVALCLKLMSNTQYTTWEKFIRLMEHVWNVTFHSTLKCSPFEAAHGLPARSVLDTYVENTDGKMVDLMTTDGVEAMKQTAKGFEKQIYQLRKEAAEKRAALARKGSKVKYKVGDEVSLFLPPSEQEAKKAGRKVKHLLFFRGPAVITKILSNTTYELSYNGRVYYRCFEELRPYKSSNLPVDLPIANEDGMQENKLIPGNFVTLCDTDDENDIYFHLCKVIAIEDDKALLLNYATWGKNLNTAKFCVMYQEQATNRYTTQKPKRNAKEREVIDHLPLEEADDYVDHFNIKMTKDMKMSKASIKQIRKLGLKHHILGKTFP